MDEKPGTGESSPLKLQIWNTVRNEKRILVIVVKWRHLKNRLLNFILRSAALSFGVKVGENAARGGKKSALFRSEKGETDRRLILRTWAKPVQYKRAYDCVNYRKWITY